MLHDTLYGDSVHGIYHVTIMHVYTALVRGGTHHCMHGKFLCDMFSYCYYKHVGMHDILHIWQSHIREPREGWWLASSPAATVYFKLNVEFLQRILVDLIFTYLWRAKVGHVYICQHILVNHPMFIQGSRDWSRFLYRSRFLYTH